MKLLVFIVLAFLLPLAHATTKPFEPKLLLGDEGVSVCNALRWRQSGLLGSRVSPFIMDYTSRGYEYPEKRTIEVEREGLPSEYLQLHPLNREGGVNHYFISSHTWSALRDKFSYYVIKKDDLKKFIATIKAGKQPTGNITEKEFTSGPFFYRDQWYVAFSNDWRMDKEIIREIYQISQVDDVKLVCKELIFDGNQAQFVLSQMPFLSSMVKLAESILRGVSSGTSRGPYRVFRKGQGYMEYALLMPQLLHLGWSTGGNIEAAMGETWERKHFYNWQFEDIWSHRQWHALQEAMPSARDELVAYYENAHGYSRKKAQRMSQSVLDSFIGRYYQLYLAYPPEYIDPDSTLEPYDFDSIAKILSERVDKNIDQLSLLTDSPDSINELEQTLRSEDGFGKTLLMYAAHMNNLDSIRYLLAHGADVNQRTHKDHSPYTTRIHERSALMYAAENASLEVIRELINHGADINAVDSSGRTIGGYLQLNPRFSVKGNRISVNNLLSEAPATPLSSFPCDVRLTKTETAICASQGLSIYDRELSTLYTELIDGLDNTKFLIANQKDWLKQRGVVCDRKGKVSKPCLAGLIRARIRYFEYLKTAADFGGG
jgi:uncharacterized protein YecT (DUF1311 family)